MKVYNIDLYDDFKVVILKSKKITLKECENK